MNSMGSRSVGYSPHRANSYALKTHNGLEVIAALALNETIEFLESMMESVITSGRVRFRLLSYLTVSTPHLGIRSTNPLLHFAFWLAGKTGREISLADVDVPGAHLIERLADRDAPWAKAVDLFRFKTLIGVVKADFVTFETATASRSNPHTTELETVREGFLILSYEGFDVTTSTIENGDTTDHQTEEAGSKNSAAGDRRYWENVFSPSFPHMVSWIAKDVTAVDSSPHISTGLPNRYFAPTYNPSNILPIADSLSALSLRVFESFKNFRRAAVSLKLPGILDRFNVHALACGKQVSGVSNAALTTTQHSAEWLASLLVTDFLVPTPSR
ncbi:hypothetical protein M427DRAFT_397121 [Gonapodya prolifera JEL478]|uniref:DUF676 domain-containing protein n=1 Tax=Gonapodya prolifera (strain JEL478) TaxID=1344416 RepID=A0A139A6U7_GONPJ|nr:hypothetical protein M427DRAFT_397121 [Gonapodya prolifera JEL478]|eukprot:KXS12424.1 hypothetical protein M427DRAFT_397121 [Gonapodya prolifera JEL478]